MYKRLGILLLLGLLCLAVLGCHRDAAPENTEGETTTAPADEPLPSDTETTPPAAETDVLSPLAVPDYLTPREDFSWEREVPSEYIMLHFTSNVVADRENPYDLDAVRSIFIENGVSIHYLIDRDGTIYGYVPENRVAWHAGKGSYADDDRLTDNMNHYAIGIELMAMGSQEDMAKYLTAEEYDGLVRSLIGYTEAHMRRSGFSCPTSAPATASPTTARISSATRITVPPSPTPESCLIGGGYLGDGEGAKRERK